MNLKLKTFGELDAKLLAETPKHTPSVPAVAATPKPERNKVAANPVRVPVNKQAAMITRPARSWILQPLATPPPTMVLQRDVDEVKAQLKTERNDHAVTRDELGNTRIKLREALDVITRKNNEIASLRATVDEQALTIQQLEDLKL